jgi:regulator of protease activity HflC (stomatin/prohibitin superfamily)
MFGGKNMNEYRGDQSRGETVREQYSLLERIAKGARKLAAPVLLGGIVALAACSEDGAGCRGCTNPTTNAGEEGYLYHVPWTFGSSKYVGTQVGPASPGLSWQVFTKNIDVMSKTYHESFDILTDDRVNLKFQAHAKIRLREGKAKTVVEKLGAQDWYKRTVQEQLRTAVREAVRPIAALKVPQQSQAIAKTILERMTTEYKNTPIVFEQISIGNMDYPDEITEANERILKQNQAKLEADAEDLAAAAQAKVLETRAKGIKKAQGIRAATLSPELIQMEAIKAYHALAESGNATFVIMPTSADATGMPLILSADSPGAYRPRPTKAAPARPAPRQPAPAKAPTKAQ